MPALTRYALRRAAVVVIISLLTACATTNELFVQEPLPLPDRPALPTVSADALLCLSDETYEALAVRDQTRAEHITRLEAVIRSTHPTPADGPDVRQ